MSLIVKFYCCGSTHGNLFSQDSVFAKNCSSESSSSILFSLFPKFNVFRCYLYCLKLLVKGYCFLGFFLNSLRNRYWSFPLLSIIEPSISTSLKACLRSRSAVALSEYFKCQSCRAGCILLLSALSAEPRVFTCMSTGHIYRLDSAFRCNLPTKAVPLKNNSKFFLTIHSYRISKSNSRTIDLFKICFIFSYTMWVWIYPQIFSILRVLMNVLSMRCMCVCSVVTHWAPHGL